MSVSTCNEWWQLPAELTIVINQSHLIVTHQPRHSVSTISHLIFIFPRSASFDKGRRGGGVAVGHRGKRIHPVQRLAMIPVNMLSER